MHDLFALLRSMANRRILIVGDVMLDEFLHGESVRLSPEAPVPVVTVNRSSVALGGAANVAANIVALGGTANVGGCLGRDAAADAVRDALSLHGIDSAGLLAVSDRPTTTKRRLIARGQQIVRMDHESRDPLPAEVQRWLLRWIEEQILEADACVLSDYGKGVASPQLVQHLIAAASRRGLPVVVDPKGVAFDKYRGASVIKPNVHEVEALLKQEIINQETLVDAGMRLVRQLDGCAVLVTRGGEGMSLFRVSAPPLHLAAVAHKVFDVTGAGDTVIATLALALAAGAALDQAIPLANLAASVVVGKAGTAVVTAAELEQELVSLAGDPRVTQPHPPGQANGRLASANSSLA